MDLAQEGTAEPGSPSDRPLVPVHPEPVADDERTLRWVMPAGTLGFVGVPAELPVLVQRLLDEEALESLTVDPTAIRTRLKAGHTWREHGAAVRTVLATALGTPEQWRPARGSAPADDLLRLAVHQVLEGEVGDYIRSHGGQVKLLSARGHKVEVQLSGACSHCPASDVTLTTRLETGIRALYPRLDRLTACSEPGHGRRMLRLLPTRSS